MRLFAKILFLIACFVLAVLLPSIAAQAQKSIIYIKDNKTKLPVQGASVHNRDYSFFQLSDELGRIHLQNGVDTIEVSCVGYATLRLPANEVTSVIYLEPKETTLEEVEIRANAKAGIFHTISSFDIHIRPIINSQEVLRIVPGLFIGQHAGGGKAEQLFLRGFDLDHGTDIKIDVDGMPVNMVSHAHGQGYADLHFVIPEMIDKVNFNKGPYFADIGNFSTAGFIDFKTKDFLDENFVKLESGQYSTARLVSGINLLPKKLRNKNQSLIWATELSYTDGYFNSPQNFSRINSIVKYHGQVGKKTSLTSTISGFSSKWYASGQIPDRAVADGTIEWFGAIDNREGGNTGRYNFNLALNTQLNHGWQWKNQLYYSRYIFELYSNFTFYLNNPVNGDEIKQKEKRNLTGLQSEITKTHQLARRTANFKAGIQIRNDATKGSELTDTKNRTTIIDRKMLGGIYESNVGIFSEERMQLCNKLSAILGLRVDYFFNQYKDQLQNLTLRANSSMISPKINFNYTVNQNIQLYLYNGKSFHTNDTRVAVLEQGRNVVTPAYGTDLGGIFKLGKNTMLQTAFWYLWLRQEFIYVGDEGVVEPGGKTLRIGWDVSLRRQVAKYLYADVDINVAKPRALGVPKAESYLPLAPVFTSSGGLSYKKEKGFSGSIRYRAMGNRPADETNSIIAKGYFICDAAINYARRNWEAGLSIQNIFNSKWKETQFLTESRLQNEPQPVNEIHFTAGTPFFARANFTIFF